MNKIKIDRARWLRGTGIDTYYYLWKDGKGDIIGNLLDFRGIDPSLFEEMEVQKVFELFGSVIPELSLPNGALKYIVNDIFNVNDDSNISDEVRERDLIKLFESIGIEVSFYN